MEDMVNVDEINLAFKDGNGVILPAHREEFLHTIGRHMEEIAPKFGKITFNFFAGKYVDASQHETYKPEKKVKV